ncbi:protein maelstrom [Drosophila simulans]|nr:protein maelstrom [Drosophila simulans]
MAPKKQNGFMMFVNEWRNRNAEGRRMTLAEAVYHCGTIWEKMDTQQRGPYNSDAKDANAARRDKRGSLNGHGQVDKAQREAAESLMDKAQREAAESLMDMKRTTERLVLNAKMSHDLENAKFVFVAFNYFTKALTTDVYVPAEFAACEYSLKEGIRSIYSTMIDPGQIIFGQGSDALHNSSTTHDLPLPPNALGEKNMVKLYRNILDYLTKCQGEGKTPIVFTPAENIGMVKSCFRYLECEDDSRDGGGKIEVFDIQYLLFILKKEVMSVAGLNDEKINKFATDAFFKNDFFEFTAGIACQYHEDNDRTKYCTQSMVTRWAYTFTDFMCGDLAITVQPGKHIPAQTKPNYRIISSDASSLDHESSFDSFYSLPGSQVKKESEPEDCSLSSSRLSVASRSSYKPKDHTSFAADLNEMSEFPSLGMRNSRKHHGSAASAQRKWNAGARN